MTSVAQTVQGVMLYGEFLARVIDQGIESALDNYAEDDMKRDGALAGFEACRDKSTLDLAHLLKEAKKDQEEARHNDKPHYWYFRCFAAEVEWVCNCVSAILHNEGEQVIIAPTARGYLKAASIIGMAAQPA